MRSLSLKLQTYYRLGLVNVLVVALYRIAVKVGYFKRLKASSKLQGPYISTQAFDESTRQEVYYFSYHKLQVASPPDWFVNPFNQKRYASLKHWSEIPDYTSELGDIKTVWELSRFDWLAKLAWRARKGDPTALPRLELWLRDWVNRNPPYTGINWKCGQEASFRCLNILTALLVLEVEKPLAGILVFLEVHMDRVAPTIYYAVAQNNNHGISEAAALFLVGSYLSHFGNSRQQLKGLKWAKMGRYWLENRVQTIILPDGSFAQHSMVYHRLMQDTLSLTELVRRHYELEPFSERFYERMHLSAQWLFGMIDSVTGDAPNLGHNDGSYLFNLSEKPYRDFRPSAQLAMALFAKQGVFLDAQHPLTEVFRLESYPEGKLESGFWSKGAYATLRAHDGFAMLRLPLYTFRPAHADALHLDLWYRGLNLLRDGGSYSYNTSPDRMNYYSGTQSHTTVRFDKRDQMIRLGRYLFAAWLRPDTLAFDDTSVVASYQDHWRAKHSRTLTATEKGWVITDQVSGFNSVAEILWHLKPGLYSLKEQSLIGEGFTLTVEGTEHLELIEMPESRHYLEETPVPVLKVRCFEPATIVTTLRFTSLI